MKQARGQVTVLEFLAELDDTHVSIWGSGQSRQAGSITWRAPLLGMHAKKQPCTLILQSLQQQQRWRGSVVREAVLSGILWHRSLWLRVLSDS